MRLLLAALLGLACLLPWAPAQVGGQGGGAATYVFEGTGPTTGYLSLAPPPGSSATIRVELRGDVTYLLTHAPTPASLWSSWYTGAPDGQGGVVPLKARVAFPGSGLGALDPEFRVILDANWVGTEGQLGPLFLVDRPGVAVLTMENVPAWTGTLQVKVDLGLAATTFSTNAPQPQASFDLLQRVVVSVE
jgi:hypothetical protein